MSERMNYQRQTARRPAPQQRQAQPPRSPAAELARAVLDHEGVFDRFAVGMTYTPWQRWGEVYCAEKALERGTLFPVLDMPFAGRRC